ncbi:MAG: KOW domain-containing RNA-binding protein [Tepidanaerobacteraceae bacterium]|jgi:ribosomal protein L14E/L6E/L27E|nr:KOW domain-containing RNA-binding protein [Tepidanaerobacteraceae bacterium]
MHEISLGQLVLSCAGRDRGRFMIVVKILDENYVYVADGTLRKVENPKKKKIKHIRVLNKKSDYIAEKLKNKRKIFNDEIKKALEELVDLGGNETSSQV